MLITGKISQAVVVAAAAYRTEAEFRERTGIQKSKLIVDEFHTNTHVSIPIVLSFAYLVISYLGKVKHRSIMHLLLTLCLPEGSKASTSHGCVLCVCLLMYASMVLSEYTDHAAFMSICSLPFSLTS